MTFSSKIGKITIEKRSKKMDGSSQDGEVKKKVIEINTFPVPFALGEIKEKITITTNIPSKPSKEQIINQAFKFHSQAKFLEVVDLFSYY